MDTQQPTADRPSRRTLLAAGGTLALAGSLRKEESPDMHSNASSAQSEAASRLDELFSDLTDQRPHHKRISVQEKATRIERLGVLLGQHKLDAVVIEPGKTFEYLTDVGWGTSERLFALVVLADGTSLWVVPSFESSRAEQRIQQAGGPKGEIIPWDEDELAWAPLAAALKGRGVERVAVEPRARAFVFTHLSQAFGSAGVLPGDAVIRDLRGVKDAHEIGLLRTANELTQKAICAVAERLEAGTTDHELGAMMRHAQQRLGLGGVWVLPLIGPDAALPHGGPTGRAMTKGDLILVDTGGSFLDYQSDNTRTWSLDAAPNQDTLRGWNCVRDAQKRAFEAMRPGVPCKDIDKAARSVIEAGGYGEGYTAFSHRLGHGIGLEGHEEPYLNGGNSLLLAPGMTFSDEPGIYLPGRFGIRLEDIVLVTEDGADHFGTWQKAPTSPA